MRPFSGSLSTLLLLGLVASGCGGKEDGSQVDGGQGSGNATGVGANGPTMLGGGASAGTLGSGGSVTIDPDMACATGTASASLSGVNMFVMFDRSSSMNDRANRSGTRWEVTSAALKAFFASPDASGLQLALRFFPHDQPAAGCNNEGCDEAACATPLVGLGALTAATAPADAQEKALIDATNAATPGMPGQGTPIFAALGGALQWATAQRQQTPNENSVVVLVTDGEANGCGDEVDDIAQLASEALAASGVRTYTIGLTGSQQRDINQIARAGGTEQGIFVSDGETTEQELIEALGAIRGQVLDCDFAVPEPKPGVDVNLGLINVNFTPTSGTPTTLAQVGSESACADQAGWYYDNPTAPTRIVLCPTSCTTVTADSMAKLDILLGCDTVTEVPK
ncbi:MAG: VWA domain-containing protein [Myxococcales bacterium]|nr:MAG: VWA domain-containing protein [Myxococcales bacterium]